MAGPPQVLIATGFPTFTTEGVESQRRNENVIDFDRRE
jgi:hypothetical protein